MSCKHYRVDQPNELHFHTILKKSKCSRFWKDSPKQTHTNPSMGISGNHVLPPTSTHLSDFKANQGYDFPKKIHSTSTLGMEAIWSSSWDQYTYPASHNHGLVENGCISNISFLSFRVIFHWTMIMSKKSPTGPSEQTLKPEYLRALSTSLVRSVGIRSHSVFDGLWEEG